MAVKDYTLLAELVDFFAPDRVPSGEWTHVNVRLRNVGTATGYLSAQVRLGDDEHITVGSGTAQLPPKAEGIVAINFRHGYRGSIRYVLYLKDDRGEIAGPDFVIEYV